MKTQHTNMQVRETPSLEKITRIVIASCIICFVSKPFLNPIGGIIQRAPDIARSVGAGVIAIGGYIGQRDKRDSVASNPSGFSLKPTWTTSKRPRMSKSITNTGGSLIKKRN